MYLTDLKVFKEEDHSIRWIESSSELIKISESMAKMLFQNGWTIYYGNPEDLKYRSWWSETEDKKGQIHYHDFPEKQHNYYVKKNAIADEKIDQDNI